MQTFSSTDNEHSDTKWFVAKYNNKIVGICELKTEPVYRIFSLVVKNPGLRIGTFIIDNCVNYLKEKNVKKLYADVSMYADSFYIKNKFKLQKNTWKFEDINIPMYRDL